MSVLKHLSKLKTSPKLIALLKASVKAYKKTTPAQKKALHEAQAASWARQDMD